MRLLRVLLFLFLILFSFQMMPQFSTVWAQEEEEAEDSGPFKRWASQDQLDKMQVIAENVNSNGWRQGGYFSIVKILVLLLIYLLWVKTCSWANNDAERLGDPDRELWNAIMLSFIPVFFVGLFIPIFWATLPVALVGYFVPTFMYVGHRNKGINPADKVMTPSHIGFVLVSLFSKKHKTKKMKYEEGPPILVEAIGKDIPDVTLNARTVTARNLPGFNVFRKLIYEGMGYNAMGLQLDVNGEETDVSYLLDGLWQPFKKIKTVEADLVFVAVKKLIGGNSEENRNRQVGQFVIKFGKGRKEKLEANLLTQGMQSGERLMVMFNETKVHFSSLTELGMSETMQAKVKALLNADKGIVVLAAAPANGLRTFANVAFRATDRYTRDFVCVEDVQNSYESIENILLTTYDSSKGETPMNVLEDVFFKEPKVLILRDLVNAESFKLCCEEVKNDRLILTTVRAKDSAEALMRLLATGVPASELATQIHAIVTQRLIRVLCEKCKESIPANPQILARLGIQQGLVQNIYRQRVRPVVQPGEKDRYVPCPNCHEIGYKGRLPLYDVLVINDEIRKIMLNNPSIDSIRQAAMKSGQRGYFEVGAELISNGLTSVEELARVVK